jgi:BMFP domain-containing protein YqiC
MQTDNRFLDDLARIASGAVGTLQGVKTEIDGLVRREMERLLSGMELVRRDEFEAVKAMAAAARQENERLAAHIAELEARLAAASNPENSAPRG